MKTVHQKLDDLWTKFYTLYADGNYRPYRVRLCPVARTQITREAEARWDGSMDHQAMTWRGLPILIEFDMSPMPVGGAAVPEEFPDEEVTIVCLELLKGAPVNGRHKYLDWEKSDD